MKTYKIELDRNVVQIRNFSTALKYISLVLMGFYLFHLVGCGYYFKVKEYNSLNDPKTNELINLKGKYVILQTPRNATNLYAVEIIGDSLKGRLKPLTPEHKENLYVTKKAGIRYKKKSEANVINEVHIHVPDNTYSLFATSVSFPLTDIQKVQVYSKDGGTTAASWVLPPVITIGALVGLAAASSCPFLYTYDGNYYNLQGELFSGATYASLERHDYMPLINFSPVDGYYQLKIANELEEIQYTNLCELLLIHHPSNSNVLIDKNGNIQTITQAQPPRIATSIGNNEVTYAVQEKDNFRYAFDDYSNKNAVNGIILTFINNEQAKSGKLTIRAKNSVWADYAYGNFTRLFGTYYNTWDANQKELSTAAMKKNALDQDVPLSVYLETTNGWKYVDYFDVVGPLTYKEMALPIDISEVKGKPVRIKLETGFMFWELDYAAMDFTANLDVQRIVVPMVSAIDEDGMDIRNQILNDDKKYLIQPDIGNEVILKFKAKAFNIPKKQNNQVSLIFHSKGYYERIRKYDNQPEWLTLIYYKHNHAFSKYSFDEYERAKEIKLLALEN